ncbi:hypothetical protein EJB05_14611 [Eragrostis curvula]|uniref:Uncharacterized protein n=1 Tax=Eragrostis curvula TaxID=38414 RepID=A0A5J9VZN5_9POAL|nr:hypothetical protein EJB05_14611 [Eragrostis curvula]
MLQVVGRSHGYGSEFGERRLPFRRRVGELVHFVAMLHVAKQYPHVLDARATLEEPETNVHVAVVLAVHVYVEIGETANTCEVMDVQLRWTATKVVHAISLLQFGCQDSCQLVVGTVDVLAAVVTDFSVGEAMGLLDDA